MWYRTSKDEAVAKRVIARVMTRTAASQGKLWKLLNDTGIASHMGIENPGDLNSWLNAHGQQGAEGVGRHVSKVPDEAVRNQIQEAFSNYMAGKILGEELRAARDTAMAEGREPSVSDLRAARKKANERLMGQAAAEGLGLPKQFQVGRRGPLTREPRLKPVSPETGGPINDEALNNLATGIWNQEMMRAKLEAQQKYDEGLSDSWEPTAADMRAAVARANAKISEIGIPFASFNIGTRGPFPRSGPRLTEVVETPSQYWARERHRRRNEEIGKEREKAEQKKDNLDLEPALDIDPETPVVLPTPGVDPSDDQLPEEHDIEQRNTDEFPNIVNRKMAQMAYQPRPPLHKHCRCSILDLGGGQVWKTAGDERVCPECEYHSKAFNSLGNT